MPYFVYKALTADRQTVEGRLDLPDRFAVYKKIKSDGQTVVYVKEEYSAKAKFLGKVRSIFGKIKTAEKITLARNLGAMIEAGLSLTRSLTVLEKQTRNPRLKLVLTTLLDDVSRGQTLADSMKKHEEVFSALFISMVRAGEESGNLAQSLRTVALQMDKNYSLVKKVRGAMIYPAIIISLMVVIGILMMIFMVPTLTVTFEGLGVDLPLSTRIVIAISNFLRGNIILVLLAFSVLIASLLLFRRTDRGKRFFHKLILKLPIVGSIAKEVNAARTARTLSSLLSSGVGVIVALGVTEEVIQNIYYKRILKEGQTNVEKGEPMSGVFIRNDKLYPIFVGEMMTVGEETGQMSQMLLNVATFYEDEVDQKTKDMSTIIEPVLMILIGIAVGVFAISMLMPTYSLVDKI